MYYKLKITKLIYPKPTYLAEAFFSSVKPISQNNNSNTSIKAHEKVKEIKAAKTVINNSKSWQLN